MQSVDWVGLLLFSCSSLLGSVLISAFLDGSLPCLDLLRLGKQAGRVVLNFLELSNSAREGRL